MYNSDLLRRVVSRWKKAEDSLGWDGSTESQDFDSLKESVREDEKIIRQFSARARKALELIRPLAAPLMSPQITKIADQGEQQIVLVEHFAASLRAMLPLAKQVEDGWEELAQKWARGDMKGYTHGLIESIHDMPSMEAYKKQAQEVVAEHNALLEAIDGDEDRVDWTLEAYVGSESGISRRLEKLAPSSWILQDVVGAGNILGFMEYWLDGDMLEERIDELKGSEEP